MHWLNRCSAFSPDTCRFWNVMEAGNDSFAPQFSISENLFQYKGIFLLAPPRIHCSFFISFFVNRGYKSQSSLGENHLDSFNFLGFIVTKQKSYDN